MKEEGGFTLVELMVVVAITVLLLSWGLPSYSSWKKKHDIESQMVQLYGDLQFVRMSAYGSKAVSGVYWGGGSSLTSYEIRSDANSNSIIDDSVDKKVGATVTPKYAITPSVDQQSVSFDCRGFLSPANPLTFYVAGSSGAAIDCVEVSGTRITLGKMNGTCMPK